MMVSSSIIMTPPQEEDQQPVAALLHNNTSPATTSKEDRTCCDFAARGGGRSTNANSAFNNGVTTLRGRRSSILTIMNADESSCSLEGSSSLECSSSVRRDPVLNERFSAIEKTRYYNNHTAAVFFEQELTINKLDFDSMGVIGREKEIAILRSCYGRLQQQQQHRQQQQHTGASSTTDEESTAESSSEHMKKELVLVKGPSGVGKSAIVKVLQTDIDNKITMNGKNGGVGVPGVCVYGKYEFTSLDEPYSGIADAFGSLCKKIYDDDDDDAPAPGMDVNIAGLSKRITTSLGREEQHMLVKLVPELRILLFDDDDDVGGIEIATEIDDSIVDTVERQERLKYAFRTLTKILVSYFGHIVIILDDLQCADVSSLDLLDYLISDKNSPHPLMIIGLFRSNEVDENTILYNRIQTLRHKRQKFGFSITDIDVKCCDEDTVNMILMSMMSMADDDEEKTRELTNICFKRTLGNPFFLIEFVNMLHAEGLLKFNLCTMKWAWDVKSIENATMSTANVVDLLHKRMRRLPEQIQLLLQYAACLGSSFSLSTLDVVWVDHAIPRVGNFTTGVLKMMKIVEEEKLIESSGSNEFRWVHDNVQEAALSLSEVVTPSFQFDLGLCLIRGLDSSHLEDQLFNVVDLINKGNVSNRVELAEINLRAARKARQISAFQSAANYASNGLEFLPDSLWLQSRTLTLDLYNLGAEMELALGNVETVSDYIRTVLQQPECTSMETVHLKVIKAKMLSTTQTRHQESIQMSCDTLHEMGYKLMWSQKLVAIEAIRLLMTTLKRVKKTPKEHFDTLHVMTDSKMRKIVMLINQVLYSAHFSKNLPLLLLAVCRLVELTLKHGVHDFSGSSIASLGTLAVGLRNDFEAMVKFSEVALMLQTKSGDRNAAQTNLIAYGFGLAWVKPFHTCLPPILDGYQKGLRMGENENSLWCLVMHFVSLPFAMGIPLGQLLSDFPKLVFQTEEARLNEHTMVVKIFWQTVAILKIASGDRMEKVDGEIYRQDLYFDNNTPQTSILHYAEGTLMVFLGRYKELADVSIVKGDLFAKLQPGSFMIIVDNFYRGIAFFAMARQTNARKYRTRAIKISRKMSKWAKTGSPQSNLYDMVLRAELAVVEKKFDKADHLFKASLVYAAKTGHLHHAALCNERYADYRLNVKQDADDAKYYLGEAAKYYSEWGAMGKAAKLKRDIDQL